MNLMGKVVQIALFLAVLGQAAPASRAQAPVFVITPEESND
jgi:hypothetical protein